MSIHRCVRLVGTASLALILLVGLLLGTKPSSLFADPPETQATGKVTSIVPPPLAVVDRLRAEGRALPPLRQLKASPSPVKPRKLQGSVNLLAILVDFSDNTATVTANLTAFDNLLFAPPVVGRGSVRDYFDAASYGNVDLVTLDMPSATGWLGAPQTYAYYVNGQYGMTGPYPNNAGGMVADILPLVDPLVNFANYDNDGDGWVDTLLIIHAGTGGEFSMNVNDMWSHAGSMSLMGGSAQSFDGVWVDRYVTAPEGLDFVTPGQVTSTTTDMTIGVICHEVAHGLWGLPDLYDLDLSSNGIGQWGLMSYGDWNGPGKWNPYVGFAVTDGSSPAFPSAWSRIVAGFDTYYMAFGPTDSTCLAPATSLSGQIYRFKTTTLAPQEYFLMENRQQLAGGYDQWLPGSGMLFWHVDEAMWSIYGGPDNNNECAPVPPSPHCWGGCASTHYLVALEQADGLDHLEYNVNRGDGGDPFPGSTGNTAWQWYWTNPRNPESGTWYDTNCALDSCIDVTGIFVQPPLNNVCFGINQAACADNEADLGDAPASINNPGLPMTAYPLIPPLPYVQANFPTVFFYPPLVSGPRHHFCQVDSWLGPAVTAEVQADAGPDQDPFNNIDPASDIPDMDSTSSGWGIDDGLPWSVPLADCAKVSLPYTVTVASTSIFPRYVNVWLDLNRDGDWADTLPCPGGTLAPEWAVQDQVLNLGQGVHQLMSDAFYPRITIAEDAPFESWLRISIAEMPAPAPQDGRGPNQGYDLGETEDYRLDLFPSLVKTASLPEDPSTGDLITYHIQFQADGNVIAQNVVISDVLPARLQYISSNPPGSYNPATRSVIWPATLIPFQSQTIDLVVQVTGGPYTTITNTAYLLWGNSIWRRSSFAFQAETFKVYLPLVYRSTP